MKRDYLALKLSSTAVLCGLIGVLAFIKHQGGISGWAIAAALLVGVGGATVASKSEFRSSRKSRSLFALTIVLTCLLVTSSEGSSIQFFISIGLFGLCELTRIWLFLERRSS